MVQATRFELVGCGSLAIVFRFELKSGRFLTYFAVKLNYESPVPYRLATPEYLFGQLV